MAIQRKKSGEWSDLGRNNDPGGVGLPRSEKDILFKPRDSAFEGMELSSITGKINGTGRNVRSVARCMLWIGSALEQRWNVDHQISNTMNYQGMNMRTVAIAGLFGAGMMLASCSTRQTTDDDTMNTPAERSVEMEAERDAEIAEERRQTQRELEGLRDRIDKHIGEVDREMERAENDASRDQLRDYRFELEQQRARVNDEIRNVE